MAKPDLSDYKEVAERIRDFRERHPEGCLQSEILDSPRDGFVVVKAYAYRKPDDPRPGTGLAWEPVPGKTPYTKDSELMNAETSAWGRAIIAVGASDAKQIASADELRNRREPEAAKAPEPKDVRVPMNEGQKNDMRRMLKEHKKLLPAEAVKSLDAALEKGCYYDYAERAIGKCIDILGNEGVEFFRGREGDIQSDDIAVGYRAGDASGAGDEVPF
jgi:hypothetical protein